MELPSSSGSSKRAKAQNNSAPVVHCLVDGCNADLSQCREYHRRHKVCEAHSKTPRVTIGGREQRFCQQCSRFHSLVEFDEGKRSCRKRLDGHNRRRRKPQSDPLSRSSGVLSNQQGTRILSFSGQQMLSSAAMSPSGWPGVVKSESNLLCNSSSPSIYLNDHSSFPESSVQHFKALNQFEFMQGTKQTLSEASICQQLLDPNPVSGNCLGSQGLFSNRLSQAFDSYCVRSLLSPSPAIVRENVLTHTLEPEFISEGQPLIHTMHCGSLGENPFSQNMENASEVPAMYSSSCNGATIHFQGMFHNEPDDTSTGGSHHMLTFKWE